MQHSQGGAEGGKEAREKEQRAAERAEINRQEQIKRFGEKAFGFGKRFRSTMIKDIPDWYVDWLYENNIVNDQVSDLGYYRYAIANQ